MCVGFNVVNRSWLWWKLFFTKFTTRWNTQTGNTCGSVLGGYCGQLWRNNYIHSSNLDGSVTFNILALQETSNLELAFTYFLWWRRRESNPRPKMLLVKRLHAYSGSCP